MDGEDLPAEKTPPPEPPPEKRNWRPMVVPKTEKEQRTEAKFRHPSFQDHPDYDPNPPENPEVLDE